MRKILSFFTSIILLSFSISLLHAENNIFPSWNSIIEHISRGKILTFSEFKGNYANELAQELLLFLRDEQGYQVVDWDTEQTVYSKDQLRWNNRVIIPEIEIRCSAHKQKSNFIFKRQEHLDYELYFIEITTGKIIYNIHERIRTKLNPPIILFVFLFFLCVIFGGSIIYYHKGHGVKYLLSGSMSLILLIIIWFIT